MTVEARHDQLTAATPMATSAMPLSAIAAIYAALFVYFVGATFTPVPVYDFLSWIAAYGDGPSNWAAYLWAPHNEHRITSDRLLVALDVEWLGGSGLPFMIFRTALLFTLIGLLVREIRRSAEAAALKAVLLPCLILMLLPAEVAVHCGMPLMGGSIYSTAMAIIALVLWQQPGKAARITALIVAVLAPFGLAGGLLIWPVMVYAAWRSRFGWGWIAAAVLVGVLTWVTYLTGIPSRAGLLQFDTERLLVSADFVIRFLGLPWSHSAALIWPSRIIGLAILLVGSFVVIADVFSKAPRSALERIGIGMVQFALLTAAAAAVSRWDTAPDREMPIRYGFFVAIAHAGILLASLRWLGALLTGRHAAKVRAVLVACAAVLLVQQVIVGRAAVAETHRYADAWARFVAGAWTPDMEHYVYPEEAPARAMLEGLKRRHIYGQ